MEIKQVIFGAGNYGKKAFAMLRKSGIDRENIVFCDNYKKTSEDLDTGVKVIDYISLKKICNFKKVSVIIATVYFMQIYTQCILDGIEIEGIYDFESDSVLEYKEYCKKNHIAYSNQKWIQYKHNKQNKVILNAKKFLEGLELSSCITEIAIMISNLCNYACIHTKCPASLVTEKKIMGMGQIKMILAELKTVGFDGTICFHIYNEPMNDPRLFSVLGYIKRELPGVLTEVYTNGYYLNQTLCNEMEDGLVDILVTTGYGFQEYERLLDLNLSIPYHIENGKLDDRLEKYDSNASYGKDTCYSLLSQVPVYVNGDLALCCLDYKHNAGLGNVFEHGLINVLNSHKVRKFQENLLEGNRNLYHLCERCSWRR